MDRGAWWATVHGVEKNWTRLQQWSTHASQFPGQDLGTAGLGALVQGLHKVIALFRGSGSRHSWAERSWFKVPTRLQHCSGLVILRLSWGGVIHL